MKYLIPFVLVLCLVGCSESNPLIGKWKLDINGLSRNDKLTMELLTGGGDYIVEFTKNSLTQIVGNKMQTVDVEYRIEGNKIFINPKGKNEWNLVVLEDNNTMTGLMTGKMIRIR